MSKEVPIYNSKDDLLENEIWIRLSQKRFENFFVSNKARVRWITPEEILIKISIFLVIFLIMMI